MPVELSERELLDAIAVLGERHDDGARIAQHALGWLGWEGEGPLLLRRYDVQVFAWYQLPVKFLASLEDKREIARGVALTLEQLGGQAATYARVLRSPETDQLLESWELSGSIGRLRFRELLADSGLEPPDTELLSWGQMMELEEASIREDVITALERAIEDGRLIPGERAFRRRQAEIVNTALLEAVDDCESRSRLEVVHAERIARWVRHGVTGRGSEERSRIIEPIAGLITAPARGIDPDAARDALEPVLWLLELAGGGITLTQTGALNRALVRDAAEHWPAWWNGELFGPPNRADELALLSAIDDLLRRSRLVRRAGRQLKITKRGTALRADPAALAVALCSELLTGDGFDPACAELVAALMLDDAAIDSSRKLAEQIHPAIVAAGWQSGGRPPEATHLTWPVGEFLLVAEALGILQRTSEGSRLRQALSGVGRALLIAGLRARATAPRKLAA
jgi:hypothetical protein